MSSNSSTALYDKSREKGLGQRTAQVYARHLLPYIEPHHRILDIGCGPGSITADLAELVPHGKVIGIDRNPDYIETAKNLAEARSLRNLSFKVADVKQELAEIESESFDIVHAHQVLLHLPEPLETMREMHRLLKPGGILSTVDSAMRVIVPPLPGVIASDATYERLSRSKGADPNFGQRHHMAANEAGFEWKDIEISLWSCGELDEEAKARLGKGAGTTANMFVAEGLIGEDEARQQKRDLEEWALLPEARWLELASALICWKR